jgi:predicted Zn-dependent protease with MMP-like domain
MDKERFKKLVEDGIDEIPEKFLKKIDNVAIVIEDDPTLEQRKKLNLKSNALLFGLYEGISQTKRGLNYSGVLPDKITIFQNQIEQYAENDQKIKDLAKNTVWHEIAHHFGLNEKEVRMAEAKRKVKI